MRSSLSAVCGRLVRLTRRLPTARRSDTASDRLVALRTEAERLSAELLAEAAPDYPGDEEAITRLEQAFRERHDIDTR